MGYQRCQLSSPSFIYYDYNRLMQLHQQVSCHHDSLTYPYQKSCIDDTQDPFLGRCMQFHWQYKC